MLGGADALGPMPPASACSRCLVYVYSCTGVEMSRQISQIITSEHGKKDWWLPPPPTPGGLEPGKPLHRCIGWVERSYKCVSVLDWKSWSAAQESVCPKEGC